MGTPSDPKEPDYEKGDHCEICKNVIFDGHTPKYVLAVFEGVESCPPFPDFGVDGEYILEQVNGFPCRWAGSKVVGGDTWFIIYWADGHSITGGSGLEITVLGAALFDSYVVSKCVTSFANIGSCILGDFTHGGSGVIRWGPDIKP